MINTNTDTLNAVIEDIIRVNGPLTATEIYEKILADDSYRKQDGTQVSLQQVNARISNYNHVFWRDENHYIHIKGDR